MGLYLTIYADFQCVNVRIEKSNECCDMKTINIFQQLPNCNVDYIVSQLKDKMFPVRHGNYKSPFGCKNKDWFFNEINHIERTLNEYFKTSKKA